MTTISEAIDRYLQTVARARSPRTERTYRTALRLFEQSLEASALEGSALDPQTADVSALDEGAVARFIERLAEMSPATEALYLTAASGFYQFLLAERLAAPNLPRLQSLIRQRSRKQGRRIPQFPRSEIEHLIDYAQDLPKKVEEEAAVNQAGAAVNQAGAAANQAGAAEAEGAPDPKSAAQAPTGGKNAHRPSGDHPSGDRLTSDRRRTRLRALRDRAFILFLADTGLRVSEACALTLGDVDFLEGRLTVIGKGDQQAVVRISRRALDALKEYLEERKVQQSNAGRKAKSLPLFTRHDRGASKEAHRLDPSSAWDLVKARAREAVGEAADQIHPHSFRHYFVTVVLLATNNIEKARRLARHKSITVTQRYAEIDPELDQDYYEIFDQGAKGGSGEG